MIDVDILVLTYLHLGPIASDTPFLCLSETDHLWINETLLTLYSNNVILMIIGWIIRVEINCLSQKQWNIIQIDNSSILPPSSIRLPLPKLPLTRLFFIWCYYILLLFPIHEHVFPIHEHVSRHCLCPYWTGWLNIALALELACCGQR